MDTTKKLVHHQFANLEDPTKRSRGWVYTLHNYGMDQLDDLSTIDCVYHVYGKEECPTTSRRHIQGFIYFKNAITRKTMSRRIPHSYVAKMRGTPLQASDYCKKDNNFLIYGTLPMSQADKGRANKERWKETWEFASTNQLLLIAQRYPQIMICHYSTLLKIKRDHSQKPADLKCLDNYWIHGLPLTGKSAFANSHDNVYIKSCNKWWMSYTGQHNIHVSDFGLEHKVLGHHIKVWCDLYPFMAEDKNGGSWLRPKTFYVTSNYTIDQIWDGDDMMIKAISRRFTVIHARRDGTDDTYGYLFKKGINSQNSSLFVDGVESLPSTPGTPFTPTINSSQSTLFSNGPSPVITRNDTPNSQCNSLGVDLHNLSDISLDVDLDHSYDGPIFPSIIPRDIQDVLLEHRNPEGF